jgi:hypothetical protein
MKCEAKHLDTKSWSSKRWSSRDLRTTMLRMRTDDQKKAHREKETSAKSRVECTRVCEDEIATAADTWRS